MPRPLPRGAADKTAAVEQLLATGMKPVQVAEPLIINARELRAVRTGGTTQPAADTNKALPDGDPTVVTGDAHDPAHRTA